MALSWLPPTENSRMTTATELGSRNLTILFSIIITSPIIIPQNLFNNISNFIYNLFLNFYAILDKARRAFEYQIYGLELDSIALSSSSRSRSSSINRARARAFGRAHIELESSSSTQLHPYTKGC